MKNLLIIGARGFGRDIYKVAVESIGYQKEYQIKGFLDDKKDALGGFNDYPPIVDTVENYVVLNNDVFICALGDVQARKKYTKLITDKDGKFISLIHPSANVDKNAIIGNGCIILYNAIVGSDANIGDHVLIQASTIIAHDVRVGNFARIDCHAVCIGGVKIEDEVSIHTSSVINHNVTVRKGATVGACSFVIRSVKEYTTVYGNPAIRLK